MATTLVPDTSVLVDGRITELIRESHPDARVVVPRAALAELEAQANRGEETGFTGLRELENLQQMSKEGRCIIEFVGRRPSVEEVERASSGAIDALIRETATDAEGVLVTSDRIQAHAAAAEGIEHIYLPPLVDEPDLSGLRVTSYFTDDTMSVHFKADCVPMAKLGRPSDVRFVPIGDAPVGHRDLRALAQECIEFAKRDYQSFVELQRRGCTVVQAGPMRITIAQPPFADGLEVTAVRPVFKAHLDDYDLPTPVRERVEGRARGVLVAGPPGSGKSTFAAAVAEHLWGLDRVVKTMESPRDLQVPREITQYGPLDGDMAGTAEVMLLVRPDHVVYDEVRTTRDFQVFADMRLAGIGLFGVTHANRAIDALQRLLGRVDLGMIPQVVDTVVFIDAGAIAQILEVSFTVRVPAGMVQEDLARPVVVVKDFQTDEEVYELYTYGEQVVVMPLEDLGPRQGTGRDRLAQRELERALRRYVRGPLEVELRGGTAQVYVDGPEVPTLIGKGGRTVQGMERRLGVRLDIRALDDRAGGRGGARGSGTGERGDVIVKRTGTNVFLSVGDFEPGQSCAVWIEGSLVGEATMARNGRLRFKASSPEGHAVLEAHKRGLEIEVAPA